MLRILFVGGGSVGHIAPSIAVWRAIQEENVTATAHFICADRNDDMVFLRSEGVTCTPIPIPRISWKFPFRFVVAYARSKKIFAEFRPDVVFSKGGALSIAPCLYAKNCGIPIVLHESDAVMGRANRLIERLASVVCLGFSSKVMSYESLVMSNSKLTTQSSRLVFTGNPIRPEIFKGSRDEGLRLTGLSGTRPILLVMGGSQGAQTINEIVWRHLEELLECCDVIHMTGRGKSPAASSFNGYWSCAFAHEELPHLYATATMALSRSGAGSISELAANGLPSILVPLTGVAQDHQRANARVVESAGGCILLEQKKLEVSLLPTIRDLCAQTGTRERLASCIRSLHHADAAVHIKDIIVQVSQRRSLARGAAGH